MKKFKWIAEMEKFTKLPEQWVKRLFDVLSDIYKERWNEIYSNPNKNSLYLDQWSTALSGLTPEEIKLGIYYCRNRPHSDVPNCIQFYHYCKGIRYPDFVKAENYGWKSSKSSVAKNYLSKIKSNLEGKACIN